MENEEPPTEAPAEAEPVPAAAEEPAPPAEPAAEPAPEEPAPPPAAAEAPAEPEPAEPEPAPAPAPEPEPEPTPAPPPPAAEPPAAEAPPPQAEATPAPAAPEESYHVVATTEDGGATEFSVAAKAGIEAAEAAGLPPPSAGTVLSSRSGFSMHSSLEGKTFKTKTGRLLSATDLNASMERLSSRGSAMSFGSNFGDLATMLSPPASARRVLTKDDVSSLVDRLYTIKKVEDLSGTKPRPMKIVFGEGGKEEFEPIEERGAKAQVEALKALYDKCLENRKKTEDELAARYLKPLGTKGRPPA